MRFDRLKETMDRYAVPDWRNLHKLWSIQLGVLSAVVSGLWMAWPAFQYVVPPLAFAAGGIAMALAAMVLRLLKQSNDNGVL